MRGFPKEVKNFPRPSVELTLHGVKIHGDDLALMLCCEYVVFGKKFCSFGKYLKEWQPIAPIFIIGKSSIREETPKKSLPSHHPQKCYFLILKKGGFKKGIF